MKKIPFSHDKRTEVSVLLSISMVIFSLILVATFAEVNANPLSNSTNPLSNSTNPLSNSTDPQANLTSDLDNKNGTIASFPGSIDSDRRHMPV